MDSKGERLERKGDVGMGRMKRPFWPGGGVGRECCGRACGGASGGLPVPGLVEVVVVRDGLGIGGVVLGALVDAVLDPGRVHLFTPLLGKELVEVEFGLGRPPGGMEERW